MVIIILPQCQPAQAHLFVTPDIVKSPSKAPPTHTSSSPPPNGSLPKTDKEERIEKARVVFGSRLAGPADRRRELDNSSTRVAGILVPPRPDEPDNCCMSGCVNCVWDRYRDELEDWAERSAEAREAIASQRAKEDKARNRTRGPRTKAGEAAMPSHVASSMDDDGGGSESLWTGNEDGSLLGAGGGQDQDLFEGVPVGIREFMRTEKKLKERKTRRTNNKEWENHLKRLNAL